MRNYFFLGLSMKRKDSEDTSPRIPYKHCQGNRSRDSLSS